MSRLKLYIFSFFEDLKGSLVDLSVIVGIIAIYQFAILKTVPDNLPAMAKGIAHSLCQASAQMCTSVQNIHVPAAGVGDATGRCTLTPTWTAQVAPVAT